MSLLNRPKKACRQNGLIYEWQGVAPLCGAATSHLAPATRPACGGQAEEAGPLRIPVGGGQVVGHRS